MKFRKNVWRGISAIMCFVSALVFCGSAIANANAGGINNALGISGATAPSGDGEIRYASSYGEFSDANLERLIADEMEYCAKQLEEGSVLLLNNGALPLASTERKVTLFGRASTDIQYRNSNGGGSADPAREINLKKALETEGFTINETLYNAYKSSSTKRVKAGDETADVGEEKLAFYTDELKSTFANFSDAAIVLLSRWGGEGTDMSRLDSEGVSQLALQPSEKDMLQMIENSGKFSKTIVIVNSVYALELGDLESYGVDACLWIGNPGYYGLAGVAKVLTGEANPSGKLVDTYATNSLSSAAMANYGGDYYTNGSDLPGHANKYAVYAEGIYVGYKYYETRYEDCILGRGNANGEAGTFASTGGWNYAEEVAFPFGYGLSYTTFAQTLDKVEYDSAKDSFTATVTVSNTGSVKGKTPVELYVQLPYTAGGIEKSAIQLVAYNKTNDLEPGAQQTLTIEFNRYLIASWDGNAHSGKGGYVLDAGTYYFAVGSDSHDALNNVLKAKGASGMYDQFGNAVEGNADCVKTYELASRDDTSYQKSPYTGEDVESLFDYADANYYYDTPVVTYLTRNDWQGTFPQTVHLEATTTIREALETHRYDITKASTPLTSVTYEKAGNLTLADMWGLEFDDAKWMQLIQQMSIEDLAKLVNENYGQGAIESIKKPATVTSEGSEGCSKKYLFGSKSIATGYASNTLLAATWSHDMQRQYGEFYGEDALYCGVHSTHGPGADTHRTPFSGRNAEYFSEDAMISYWCGMETQNAMASKGLANNFKHFFLNDQENGRQGIATYANEQAIREQYLRAYEGGVTAEGGIAMMTSYNRIGTVYMAADPTVQFDLLRNEWGYLGYTMTDYIQAGDYSSTPDAIIGGTDIFGGNDRVAEIKQLVLRNKNTSGDIVLAMQESAHRILWTYAHTSMMNGLAPNATVQDFVAWWQYALTAIEIVIGLITAGCLAMYVVSAYVKKKEVQA